jgi:hypothetical protein
MATRKLYIVLVYGGRDYAARDFVFSSLDALESRLCKFVVLQGGARGADRLGKEWGNLNGYPGVQIDAIWDYYQNSAGPIRNRWMQEIMHPDMGVEFPGDKGTADMHTVLAREGIPVWQPVTQSLDDFMNQFTALHPTA